MFVVSLMSQPLYPKGRNPRDTVNRPEHCKEENDLFPLPGIELQFFGHPASSLIVKTWLCVMYLVARVMEIRLEDKKSSK
jgi:hypothetical protein